VIAGHARVSLAVLLDLTRGVVDFAQPLVRAHWSAHDPCRAAGRCDGTPEVPSAKLTDPTDPANDKGTALLKGR
jgi:hypothetical protein